MKLVKPTKSFLSITAIVFSTIAGAGVSAKADTTLFFDDFNGPTLNPVWQASLPNANLAAPQLWGPASATYLGAPNYSFQTWGGQTVLRLNNNLSDLQRRGWSSSTTYNPSAFSYELRFNTLIQSSATSIDSFIEFWILDPTNPGRYDIVSLFGGAYGDDLRFAVGSSIDNTYGTQAFSYQNNTWYRLLIQNLPGQNIRVSLNNDSGIELIGQTLNHTEGAYSSGFTLCLSQGMGMPGGAYPVDVAVDYIQLTAIPEPGSGFLTITGLIVLAAVGKRRSAKVRA
jgi:hypothetical protein